MLILASEGTQILALTLDIALKLKYLGETIIFCCEEPMPDQRSAIQLLRSTISDMEIDYARGAMEEKDAIDFIISSLWDQSDLCSSSMAVNNTDYGLNPVTVQSLMGNVTVSLFSSMGITPAKGDLSRFGSEKLLMMYIQLLVFVYVYYFVVVSVTMVLFAVFSGLARRHRRRLHTMVAVGIRLLIAILLIALVSISKNFHLMYQFMTSPIILFAFALALFSGLWAHPFLAGAVIGGLCPPWTNASYRDSSCGRSIYRSDGFVYEQHEQLYPIAGKGRPACHLFARTRIMA